MTEELASRSYLAAKLTFVVLLGILAWMCVGSATERAGWSWPSSWWGASSARAAAIVALAGGDAESAIGAAETSLAREPIDRFSAPILAEALLLGNNTEGAARAYSLGVVSGWRGREAQEWAVEATLANEDWARAAVHLDALHRLSPQGTLPARWLIAIERHPAGRTALASRLAFSPAWSRDWLRSAATLPPSALENRIKAIEEARSSGLQIPQGVAADASRRMISRHPQHALPFWHAMAGPGDSRRDGIWDSSFKRGKLTANAGPFEWRNSDSTGVELRHKTTPQPHLEIDELKATASTLLETFIGLRPGLYTIDATIVRSPAPVYFAIVCYSSSTIKYHSGASSANNTRGLQFEVPSGCPLQRLSLVADGAGAARSEGSIGQLHISKDSGD